MAEKEVRRTTAKKTVRKTATTASATRTSVRRSSASSVRKAPIQAQASVSTLSRKAPHKGFILGLILFVVLLGVSALIGYSDKGQLDVASTISSRIQNATPEEQETFKTVPIQQGQTENSAPNGGLVGMGQPEIPPPVLETESTSTEDVATSTEATSSTTTPEIAPEPAAEDAPQEEVTVPAE